MSYKGRYEGSVLRALKVSGGNRLPRNGLTDIFNGFDLPADATITSAARSVVDYQGKSSPTPANTLAIKGGRQASTLAEGATWGNELQANGTFTSWIGDNPSGWSVSTENATNYITQDAQGCKIVSDGGFINMGSGVSFTRFQRYHIVVDVVEVTGSFIFRLGSGPGNTDTDLVAGINTIDAVNNGADTYGVIGRKLGGTPGYIIIRSVSAKLSSPTKWLDYSVDGSKFVSPLSIRTLNGSRSYYPDTIPSGEFKRCDIASGVVLTLPTTGRWRTQDQGFCMRFVPGSTGQTGALFSSYVDADNSTSLLLTPTTVVLRKRIAGVNHDATITYTHTIGQTFDVIGCWTAHGIGLRLHKYTSDTLSTWLAWAADTDDTAAQIATTIQVGGENGGSPVIGNIQFLAPAYLAECETLATYTSQVDNIFASFATMEQPGPALILGASTDHHYNPGTNPDTTTPIINELQRRGIANYLNIGDNYDGWNYGYTEPPDTNWVDAADMEAQVTAYEQLFSGFNNVLFATGNHDRLLSGDFTEYWAFSQYAKKNAYLVIGSYRIISIQNSGLPDYTTDAESLQYLADQLALAITNSQSAIIMMHVPDANSLQQAQITSAINTAVTNGATIRMVLYGHTHAFATSTIGTSAVPTYTLDGAREAAVFYIFRLIAGALTVTEVYTS